MMLPPANYHRASTAKSSTRYLSPVSPNSGELKRPVNSIVYVYDHFRD